MYACLRFSLRKGNTTRDQDIFTLRVLMCPYCSWLIFLIDREPSFRVFRADFIVQSRFIVNHGLTVKRQSLSTTVLFRTTFTRTIVLNLLIKWFVIGIYPGFPYSAFEQQTAQYVKAIDYQSFKREHEDIVVFKNCQNWGSITLSLFF